MSKPKIKLIEQSTQYGFANQEFIDKIEERYMKRVGHRLKGDNDGEIFKHPIVKRNDEDTYDNHRLEVVLGYVMGALDWNIDELDCGPLLGLYDHKGGLSSYWDGSATPSEIAVVHAAWYSQYEDFHHAVIFNGIGDPATREYYVRYETAN
jgi:hypothetical protein